MAHLWWPWDALKSAGEETMFCNIPHHQQNRPLFQNSTAKQLRFWERYAERGDRIKYNRIELVSRAPFNKNSSMNRSFNNGMTGNPLNIFSTSLQSAGKILYLLDTNAGWPLLAEENNLNTALVSVSEFRSFLNSTSRIERAYELNGDYISEITGEPLFPVNVFGNEFIDILKKYPFAIPFFNHWYLILDENVTSFRYVIKWIAKIAADPSDMSNICGLVFYSKTQGIGKSIAIKMTMSLFAPFIQETQSLDRVFDRFSDIMEFCVLLHLEDAPLAQLNKLQDELKGRLTAESLVVEKKNNQTYQVSNFCRVMISTNQEKALKLTPEDRRWAAFGCSPVLKEKKLYFNQLARYWQLHRSKCDVLSALMEIPGIDEFDAESQRPRTPYLEHLMTWSSTQQQVVVSSKKPIIKTIMDKTHEFGLKYFLEGVHHFFATTSLARMQAVFAKKDIYYTEPNSPFLPANFASEGQNHFWIKISLLPALFYTWYYGGSRFIENFWLQVSQDQQEVLSREFKAKLAMVLPTMQSFSIYKKQKNSYYPFEYSYSQNSKKDNLKSKVVDLILLYQSLIVLPNITKPLSHSQFSQSQPPPLKRYDNSTASQQNINSMLQQQVLQPKHQIVVTTQSSRFKLVRTNDHLIKEEDLEGELPRQEGETANNKQMREKEEKEDEDWQRFQKMEELDENYLVQQDQQLLNQLASLPFMNISPLIINSNSNSNSNTFPKN